MCPGYACSWEADRRRRIVLSALAAGTAGPAPIAGPGRVLRMPRVARRRAGSPLLCSVGTGASRCESHGHCHVGPALLGTSRRSSVTVHARVPHRSAASPQSVGQFRAGPRGRVSQLCWLRQASGHSSWAGRRACPGQTGPGQAGPGPHRSHASRGPCRGPAGAAGPGRQGRGPAGSPSSAGRGTDGHTRHGPSTSRRAATRTSRNPRGTPPPAGPGPTTRTSLLNGHSSVKVKRHRPGLRSVARPKPVPLITPCPCIPAESNMSKSHAFD